MGPLRPDFCWTSPPAEDGVPWLAPEGFETAVACCGGVAAASFAGSGCFTKARSSWQRLAGRPVGAAVLLSCARALSAKSKAPAKPITWAKVVSRRVIKCPPPKRLVSLQLALE